MKLISLKLTNFKGIRNFSLDANGQDVSIFGDNATGKTTLADAFMWLLFDKDSANRKDFEIKTLGPDGEPEHGLEHTVEAILELDDGQQIALKKVYQEKWTKKRGSATAEFTGHTTSHYIDGVPVKKNEYEAQVSSIAGEDVFKLLTSPTYFNEQLHWQERRRILLEVCGDVSDAEVIASSEALARLPEILQGRKLEDHRKVISARRAEINRELEKIPVRIDEAQKNLPNLEGIVPEKLQEDIAKLKAERAKKQEELARLEAGGAIAEKTKQLREIELEIMAAQKRAGERQAAKAQEVRAALNDLWKQISALQSQHRANEGQINADMLTIDQLEAKIASLREEWYRVNAETFDEPDTCPTCGQTLPEGKREEARAAFNRQKAERLEGITSTGKAIRADVGRLKAEISKLEEQNTKLAEQIAQLESNADELKQTLDQLSRQVDMSGDLTWLALQQRKQELGKEIEEMQAGNAAATAPVRQEIANLDMALEALEKAAAQVEARKRGLERIEELKAQERRLAAEYERLEQELYLTEEFIRAKVRLLEDKINSKFQMARFKLFNVLVNGGIEECCETTYNGVPYSNLNSGARLNVGLDIINVLADHFGFAPPVWVDNAESVTNILPTKGQQIRLVVSEKDKKLRVELEELKGTGLFKEVV